MDEWTRGHTQEHTQAPDPASKPCEVKVIIRESGADPILLLLLLPDTLAGSKRRLLLPYTMTVRLCLRLFDFAILESPFTRVNKV